MFKSKIPLQTPLAVKIVLSTTIITFFAGWSLSGDASGEGFDSIKSRIVLNQQDWEFKPLVEEIHDAINEYRNAQGLRPLILDTKISQQAQIHSLNMAQDKANFSHAGFKLRIQNIASSIDYQSAAENIAYNQGYSDPGMVAVKGWIKSPGHQKNMVGNYNLTGVGVAQNSQGEYYFTQIFVLEK